MSLPLGKPTVSVQIKGLEEAIKLLKEFGDTTIPKMIPDALNQLGDDMVTSMQGNAPVRTGYLRSHIAKSVAGTELTVESSAPYSGFVNFGTIHQKPQPFFSSTVETIAPGFFETVRKDAMANLANLLTKYKPT